MGRRSGFVGIVSAIARDAARAQRQAQSAQLRAIRAQERYSRQLVRDAKQQEKEAKIAYTENRIAEAEDKNSDLALELEDLRSVLAKTLSIDDRIEFNSLKVSTNYEEFKPSTDLATPRPEPKLDEFLVKAKQPSGLGKILPGAGKRYEREKEKAIAEFKDARKSYEEGEIKRQTKLAELQVEYDSKKSAFLNEASQRNQEVDELENAYKKGEPFAIVAYNNMVLERSEYPEDFPQEFQIAYSPESRQLVVDYELPSPAIVPRTAEYRYIKAQDIFQEKPRKENEIKELYQDIVTSTCLRTLHEVFEADQGNHLDCAVFNGFIQTVDPATGKDIRPYLISVRTTKGTFINIELSKIDKRACLRNLGAQVSPRPFEVQAIKPIIEFNMVDKRYVSQSDVLSDLESRPNLMELNPFEFENLVSNLFQKMGLETKQTRSSKDGGVDAVAFDARPVVGGKVVIQAKRYKNTVGVSAVRDLYGTMMNEGANKGILVTTSGYGPDAFEFSKDKPIELIDGGGLLYLLDQVGIKARIVFVDDKSEN
jgi:restriction system protein